MEKKARKAVTTKRCAPCETLGKAYSPEEALRKVQNLNGWQLAWDGKSIRKEYVMKDFMAAVHLVQGIARLAEEEGHHPDLHLTRYRSLAVELSTHALGGLTDNDFVLAAKIDALPKELKS